jgi:hypothetical protein
MTPWKPALLRPIKGNAPISSNGTLAEGISGSGIEKLLRKAGSSNLGREKPQKRIRRSVNPIHQSVSEAIQKR